ncbi:helix-turn-helix transcriptional regulator [Microbacterium sp. Marseille-Q6965]|uniref:ArsR/SmtB family transcription factor n=1 Tax=Microbacterium sp. Marseille-Q6965 TaxID=2965072 RepID=UPI0021B76399|nr:helix-turn-helix domain-containing protein [Microbacterium sp. Marseille-Q6965]
MRALAHPSRDSITLPVVLSALSDPIRLDVVRQLAASGGVVCGQFDALEKVSMSTLSHHLKVLREAGVIRVDQKGSFRQHELRATDLETLFPGVLRSIVATFHLELTDTAQPAA